MAWKSGIHEKNGAKKAQATVPLKGPSHQITVDSLVAMASKSGPHIVHIHEKKLR
jgi:hypothetical protein